MVSLVPHITLNGPSLHLLSKLVDKIVVQFFVKHVSIFKKFNRPNKELFYLLSAFSRQLCGGYRQCASDNFFAILWTLDWLWNKCLRKNWCVREVVDVRSIFYHLQYLPSTLRLGRLDSWNTLVSSLRKYWRDTKSMPTKNLTSTWIWSSR